MKLFGAGYQSIELSTVVNTLKIPRSTAWRILDELSREGILERTSSTEFLPGPGAMALGHAYMRTNPAAVAIRASVRRLHVATLCSTYLIQHSWDCALTLDIMPGNEPLEQKGYVGERRRPWESASGRLMMAHMPEDEAFALLPDTIQPTWRLLNSQFRQIRRDELSLLENARTPGYISASILTDVPGQEGLFALSISWRDDEADPERKNWLMRMLADEAATLSSTTVED